ncbi:TonB-dependent receptor [Neptunicella marina]|uniref:TonB-dependent receptor n=1 Tax=Neptunicella marina TaxID=2125989 RepID=A0A8J6IXS5_9ALTE|nr:TonB-dependent receptor [Neptunicella marina]MBC3767372.1 TonB-dependent receptor [Neptunicella marina]
MSSSIHAQEQLLERIEIKSSRSLSNNDQQSLSASLLQQSDINLQQAVHISELLSQVAGSWISRGNGQESLISIRSPVLTGAGACGAFVIAEMGVPVRPMGFCNANQLFELNTEQAQYIDVIRGPVSAQYDGNAVHGVINSQPLSVFQSSPLSIDLTMGERRYQRSKFRVGLHNDSSGWLLYGNQSRENGYQPDSGYEQQKANFIYQHLQHDFDSTLLIATTHLNQQSAGYIEGFNAYKKPELVRINANPDAYRHASALRISSQLNWYQNQTTWSITPYLRHSFMRFSQHWVPWQPTEVNQQVSAGMLSKWHQQLETGSITLGLDNEFAQSELSEYQSEPFSASIPQGFHYDYSLNSQLTSVWANYNRPLNNQLEIDFSLRWSQLDYDYDNHLSNGSACTTDTVNCRYFRPADTALTFTNMSPRLALIYRLTGDSNLYIAMSQGYRPPQSSELFRLQQGQQLADLQSETLTNIELGLKKSLNWISWAFTLFDMHKNHYIFQDTERHNYSDGKTRHTGAEIEASVDLSDKLSLGINGSYSRHSYTNNIQISSENIKGNDIDSAPRLLAQVNLKWRPVSQLMTQLSWQHQGAYYLNPQNSQRYPGHNLLHLSTNYSLNEALSWHISVRNLLNTRYAERADFAFNQHRYFTGLPRTIYIGLEWQQQ